MWYFEGDVYLLYFQNGSTPLIIASEHGMTNIVRALLQRSADINHVNMVYNYVTCACTFRRIGLPRQLF